MTPVKWYVEQNLAKSNAEIVADYNALTAGDEEPRILTEAEVAAARTSIAFENKTNALRVIANRRYDAVINGIMKEEIVNEAQIISAFGA